MSENPIEYTKLEARQDPRDGSWIIMASGGGVATVSGKIYADLICAAVNACILIDGKEPERVARFIEQNADKIGVMYDSQNRNRR